MSKDIKYLCHAAFYAHAHAQTLTKVACFWKVVPQSPFSDPRLSGTDIPDLTGTCVRHVEKAVPTQPV